MKNRHSRYDIIYFDGPGDTIGVFSSWLNNNSFLTETAVTYSSQFFDFCKENNLSSFAISIKGNKNHIQTEQFRVQCIPKKIFGKGVLYHLSQLLYGFRIVGIGLYYRPKYLAITSGVTYQFILAPLKLFGIKVVSHLHNCLWSDGYRPESTGKKLLLNLESWYFKNIAFAMICVAPMVKRQIIELTGKPNLNIHVFRAQFHANDFPELLSTQDHNLKPFNIVFSSRVERNKGVFDILDMAEQLRNDSVTFEICGGGSDLEEFKNECQKRDLNSIITIHGQLNKPDLLAAYIRSHAVIVPTRSEFIEGFPKVAIEAVLSYRPVICSSVFNDPEILPNAVISVPAENIDAYVKCIRQLITDANLYQSLCDHCPPLREQFFDGKMGLKSALRKVYLSNIDK